MNYAEYGNHNLSMIVSEVIHESYSSLTLILDQGEILDEHLINFEKVFDTFSDNLLRKMMI